MRADLTLSTDRCTINLHLTDRTVIQGQTALKANITITSSHSSMAAPMHSKASNSIHFVEITLLTGGATFNNKVLTVDFQALRPNLLHLHHHKEHAEDISATYNGLRQAQSAVDHIRTFQAAIRTLSKLRLRHLINHHETPLRPLPMKTTIRFGLRRTCRWRMRRRNPNPGQAENTMVILSKRMPLNSASLSSRNHLRFLQRSLHQI
jgi:hypothetical protein